MPRAGRQLELTGVFASSITPHRAETPEADFAGALDLIDFLASAGVRGIGLFSATGEFLNYSFAERQRLVYLGTKRSRVPLIAGVSHSTLTGAIQLADEAISSGADGLLLMPPYFYRYAQPEIEEFYLQFAREIHGGVPLLLHNIPQFAPALERDTIRRLADTGLFAGIEDCSGDREFLACLLELKRDRPFAVLAGNERIAADALRAGADGLISGCACAVPELVVGLAKAIATDDHARAENLNGRLLEFLDWTERFPAPVAIKQAVSLRKQKSGPQLIPLAAPTSQLLQEFSAWFVKWQSQYE